MVMNLTILPWDRIPTKIMKQKSPVILGFIPHGDISISPHIQSSTIIPVTTSPGHRLGQKLSELAAFHQSWQLATSGGSVWLNDPAELVSSFFWLEGTF